MEARIAEQDESLQTASLMHNQVSGLIDEGILRPDNQGNIELNVEGDGFEQRIADKINTSKQKAQFAAAQLNQQVDHHSQQSFQSAHQDEELEDLS